jgi:hypothetical protein
LEQSRARHWPGVLLYGRRNRRVEFEFMTR